jgi:hypothetical protein
MKIQRMLLIKIHAFLACFFIPMAALVFVSGAMYSLGVKGHIDKQVYTLPLDHPFSPDLAALSALARLELDQRHLVPPGGDTTVREKKGAYEFRWGDLHRLVVIKPTNNPQEVELTYRERSPLAQVMRVHRAEAGSAVKIITVSMAAALLVILTSGVWLAVGIPKLRRNALFALAAGVIALIPVFI